MFRVSQCLKGKHTDFLHFSHPLNASNWLQAVSLCTAESHVAAQRLKETLQGPVMHLKWTGQAAPCRTVIAQSWTLQGEK